MTAASQRTRRSLTPWLPSVLVHSAARRAALLPCCVLLLALPLQAATVRDVRLWRAPDHTRVVLDLDAPAEHAMLVLENPARVVLDVRDTVLRAGLEELALANTPIRRLRSGIRDGNDLRLVFDVSAPVTPRTLFLPASAQAGDRLVLDLYDQRADEGTVYKSVDVDGRRDVVIAIDAGHGGEDPGALGPNRLREKDVVLAIARELHTLLEREPGFRPTLIRTGDYYISLKGRRDLARERQADLFVSIHADAFRRPEAYGASVYALSTTGATSTTASFLAQSENAADLIGGVRLTDYDEALANVLTSLSMDSTLDQSLTVGSAVLGHMGGIARLHKAQVEQAGFAVLKSPDIPSILVETGFISNPGEARKLATEAYRRRMARAIFDGIRDWFRRAPPAGTLLAWQRSQGVREYTIARGDTLSQIAERFNVSVRDLKSHNGLRSNVIQAGRTLKIPAS